MNDEALEKLVGRLMLQPAATNIPKPIETKSAYGYDVHKCPICGKLCLIRSGGYIKHYTKTHDTSQSRQKAKAIISAVRNHDKGK